MTLRMCVLWLNFFWDNVWYVFCNFVNIFINFVVIKMTFFREQIAGHLLGRGVFGDSLGSLGHSVLGQLSWEKKADSCLDFP